MNVEMRFPIKPGGRYYTIAQMIVEVVHNPAKHTHAKVSCGYIRVLTTNSKPLDPKTAQDIIDTLLAAEILRDLPTEIDLHIPA